MKLYNGTFDDFSKLVNQKRIVLYGTGSYFRDYISSIFPEEWLGQVEYAVDNRKHGNTVRVREKEIPVYKVEKVKLETDCVVVLTSSTVMYEMYKQLEELQLGDSILCCAYPLILAKSTGKNDPLLEDIIFNNKGIDKIKKIIHCFWFSCEKKPENYQMCIDSWKRVCPDYEIKEWNINNYDYTVNSFMEQAVKRRKWAFAADVARLDVLYRQGGIYMDMDVELLKPLDILLKNEAFFTFETNNDIDLAMFGAGSGNQLLKNLLKLYENAEFHGGIDTMNRFCQPVYIRKTIRSYGINQNGNMQYVDNMAFLPRYYLAPKDAFLYELGVMNEDTIAVHHCNYGWKDSDYKVRKTKSARKLRDLIEKRQSQQIAVVK